MQAKKERARPLAGSVEIGFGANADDAILMALAARCIRPQAYIAGKKDAWDGIDGTKNCILLMSCDRDQVMKRRGDGTSCRTTSCAWPTAGRQS